MARKSGPPGEIPVTLSGKYGVQIFTNVQNPTGWPAFAGHDS
jgi:hypothetical protein